MTISSKIGVIISIGAILSLSIASFLIFNLTKSALRQSISNNQVEIARQTLNKIDRLLYGRYLDIQVIASEHSLEQFLLDKKHIESLRERITGLTFLTGPWDELTILDTSKQILLSTNTDVSGAISEEKRLAFGQAILGKAYYSDNVLHKGRPTVLFSAPIRNNKILSRPVIGVVIGSLSWPVVTEIMRSSRTDSQFNLYNKSSSLIATSKDLGQDLFLEDTLVAPIIKDLLIAKHSAITSVWSDDKDSFLVSSVLSQGYLAYKGNQWALIIKTPTSIALASATSVARRTTLFLFPVFLLAVLIILPLLKRYLVRPIVNLTMVTKEISAGNLDKRVEVKSQDEIGTLGNAFNSMAEKLQEFYAGLEQKVKERTVELEAASAQLETILNNLPVGVFLVEINTGRPLIVNNAAINILGKGVDPKAGKGNYAEVYSLIKDDGAPYPSEETPLAITIRTGKSVFGVTGISVKKTDGTILSLRSSSVMVKDKNGRPISCVVIFEDITKEKQIDKAKTEFVSLASHQLRTPLSTVNWYTEMLLAGDAGKINKKQKKYLDEIYTGNQRMVELVNDLLDVSRLELGTFSVDTEPTDIVKLAQDVMKEQNPQITERKIKLTSDFAKDIPIMQADQKLLRIVFQNLLSNAVKYTPEGGSIKFGISLDKEKHHVNIQVADTGYGIPKNHRDKIFTKLFRADNVREKDTKGTGLGLYIVKSIIDLTEGTIRFESEENKGTTFYVSLPIEGMKKRGVTKALG